MNVKQLIEKLEQMPQDLPVFLAAEDSGDECEVESVDIKDIVVSSRKLVDGVWDGQSYQSAVVIGW